jgi:hypothetical protein
MMYLVKRSDLIKPRQNDRLGKIAKFWETLIASVRVKNYPDRNYNVHPMLSAQSAVTRTGVSCVHDEWKVTRNVSTVPKPEAMRV